MKFTAGDDVVVDFAGIQHQGEVIEQRSGYVMVRICVKETHVRHK